MRGAVSMVIVGLRARRDDSANDAGRHGSASCAASPVASCERTFATVNPLASGVNSHDRSRCNHPAMRAILVLVVALTVSGESLAGAATSITPRDRLVGYVRVHDPLTASFLTGSWFGISGGHQVLANGQNVLRGQELDVQTNLLTRFRLKETLERVCAGVRRAVHALSLKQVSLIVLWSFDNQPLMSDPARPDMKFWPTHC